MNEKNIIINKRKAVYSLLVLTSVIVLGGGSYLALNHSNKSNTRPKAQSSVEFKKETETKAKMQNENKNQTKEAKDPAAAVYEQFDLKPKTLFPVTPFFETSELNEAYLTLMSTPPAYEVRNETQESTPIINLPNIEEPSIQLPEITQPENGLTPIPTPIWINPQLISNVSSIIVDQGSVFLPEKYFTVILGSDLQPVLTISSIDTTTLGKQLLEITLQDSQGYQSKISIPVFINGRPTLQLVDPARIVHIGHSIDLMSGVQASDIEDGDLSDRITYTTNLDSEKEGTYTVVYTVTDNSGSTATSQGTIQVINDAPVIHVPATIEHQAKSLFDPLKEVQVTDTEDGQINLTSANILENHVNISKEGIYKVKIGNVKDKHGKAAADITYYVSVVNHAPILNDVDLTSHVFTEITREEFIDKLIYSDREDTNEELSVTIDEQAWHAVNTNIPRVYLVPVTVTDSLGKSATIDGRITIINDKPVFEGVVDRKITAGDTSFDPLEGIAVSDMEEPLTLEDVEVSGDFDINTPGTYLITLTIRDSFDTVQVSYILTVIENEEEDHEII